MKKKYKFILAAGLLVVCVIAGAFYLLQPKLVETQAVTYGALSESITEQGKLSPERSITINAGITGTVGKLEFNAGRDIEGGETLFEIDATTAKKQMEDQIKSLKLQQAAIYSGNDTTQAEIKLRAEQLRQQLTAAKQQYDRLFGSGESAEALLGVAKSNYTLARRNYQDFKDYYGDDGFTSGDSELDTQLYTLRNQMNIARQNLIIAASENSESTRAYYNNLIASCEAQLAALGKNDSYAKSSANAAAQQLQITIDDLQEKLELGTVTAPHGGVIWRILVNEGDFVAENQPVASLYLEEGMLIEVPLLVQDALALRVGDTAQCRFADGTAIAATVRFVSPVAEDVVSTIGLTENRCVAELIPSEMPANTGAGHQVDVTFSFVAAENALSVLAGSIVPYEAGSAVYVVRGRKAVLVPVETGVQRGGRVEILSGLEEGDEVILNPYENKIQNGSRVAAKAL
ncbi:HlyD family efflux transporter periplasmic adaptor subunit [Hydrogenoanaerobacterium sp.]|uniref:efflux RND transporter periplasmic adaptor subunit n=1 Tax=Hydrogenoanaerobacterium sp. TaxID=2953763 RepID=UPI0028A0A5E1|nr:HlyD family efflux transporter periplasmic adaptor subunit [Hydrogenoanaerobacterium sp.]